MYPITYLNLPTPSTCLQPTGVHALYDSVVHHTDDYQLRQRFVNGKLEICLPALSVIF